MQLHKHARPSVSIPSLLRVNQKGINSSHNHPTICLYYVANTLEISPPTKMPHPVGSPSPPGSLFLAASFLCSEPAFPAVGQLTGSAASSLTLRVGLRKDRHQFVILKSVFRRPATAMVPHLTTVLALLLPAGHSHSRADIVGGGSLGGRQQQ